MKKKKKTKNTEDLASAIKQQAYDMEHSDHIKHHRDNETNRKRNGLPSRRRNK